MHYAFFLECLYFRFQFSFVLFAAINGWTQKTSFGGDALRFSFAKNTIFHSCRSTGVLFFLELRLAFFFALIFVQMLLYLCIKVYLDRWSMLVFIKRVVSKRFEWCWKREKSFMQKVVQKGACLDCGLDFCMPYLMTF
jgi:hypothetical protein